MGLALLAHILRTALFRLRSMLHSIDYRVYVQSTEQQSIYEYRYPHRVSEIHDILLKSSRLIKEYKIIKAHKHCANSHTPE